MFYTYVYSFLLYINLKNRQRYKHCTLHNSQIIYTPTRSHTATINCPIGLENISLPSTVKITRAAEIKELARQRD